MKLGSQMVCNPKKSNFFMIFCKFLPHKGHFCWKLHSQVIYTIYLNHKKYPICAPIFHLLYETESYMSGFWEKFGPTFQCIVVLQSRGHVPINCSTNVVSWFAIDNNINHNFKPCFIQRITNKRFALSMRYTRFSFPGTMASGDFLMVQWTQCGF